MQMKGPKDYVQADRRLDAFLLSFIPFLIAPHNFEVMLLL